MNDCSVRLMHYDARWRQEFEQTRSSLFFCGDGWMNRIDHVGSTAISGLIARPTIDVIACVSDDEGMQHAESLIEGLNFRSVEAPPWADGTKVLIKPRAAHAEDPEATHRIFLVTDTHEAPSPLRNRMIRVRDYLRDDPERSIDFEEFKVQAWKQTDGNLDAYLERKAGWFDRLEDEIP
ncbi:MAG: GrpB family protein [Planctomycetota bacterium]